MANIKSSKKDILRSEKARQRNVACKSAVKTARRKVLDALAAGDVETARKLFGAAESLIAQAARKGVIKKATMGRKISRLAQRVKGAVK